MEERVATNLEVSPVRSTPTTTTTIHNDEVPAGMKSETNSEVSDCKGAVNMEESKSEWCTNGGSKHDWQRWHNFTPVKKYRCLRKGCGFFKKCWMKCSTADTTCTGCHVIQHKRW